MPQKALTSASNKLDHRNFLVSTSKNLAKTWAYWKWTPKTKGFLARRLHTFITWHMWDPFKMTPLQGEPAGESNTTCIGLLQHGPGEVSQTNSAWTFWGNNTPSVVKMAIGFHQKHLYLVSGVPQTPEASNRTPACGVLSSGYWELEGQQRLDPLTCFYDQIFWSVHFITHHHSVFYFRLATSLPKQTAELHSETIGSGASTVITSHTHAIQHNLVQVKNQATSSLTVSTWSANDPSYFFHNLPCEGWWPESESGPEKKTTNEALKPYHDVLMFSYSNNKVISYQVPAWDGDWRQNDVKWLESSSCASHNSHNIVLTKLQWDHRGVRESKPSQSLSGCPTNFPNQQHLLQRLQPLGSTKAKCKSTGSCWLSDMRCVDWMSVSSKSPKTQNLSPVTKWMMKGVCSCWLLTAVSWPLTVHGPRHLNCGTGMAGQRNKGQLKAVIVQ